MTADNENLGPEGVERRFWKRLLADDSVVTIGKEPVCYEAQVIDKSFGGVALNLQESSGLAEGDLVTITCEGESVQARIRRLKQIEDSSIRVACEWLAEAGAFGKIFNQLVGRDT